MNDLQGKESEFERRNREINTLGLYLVGFLKDLESFLRENADDLDPSLFDHFDFVLGKFKRSVDLPKPVEPSPLTEEELKALSGVEFGDEDL